MMAHLDKVKRDKLVESGQELRRCQCHHSHHYYQNHHKSSRLPGDLNHQNYQNTLDPHYHCDRQKRHDPRNHFRSVLSNFIFTWSICLLTLFINLHSITSWGKNIYVKDLHRRKENLIGWLLNMWIVGWLIGCFDRLVSYYMDWWLIGRLFRLVGWLIGRLVDSELVGW